MDPPIACVSCRENMVFTANKSNCICKLGYYQSSKGGECFPCELQGCVNCSTVDICDECNVTAGYYLTGSTCKHDLNESDYIYSQSQTGIIVEFDANITNVISVKGELQRVKNKMNLYENVEKSIELETLNYTLTGPHVLYVRFQHPNKTLTKHTLAITYEYMVRKQKRRLQEAESADVSEADQEVGAKYESVNAESIVYVRRPIFYSYDETRVNDLGQYEVELGMTVFVMVICSALYAKGYKHNQIPFFLQTLAFIGYAVKDDQFEMATFLYNLRWSYYDYGNAISGIIPDLYMESSKGNFPFFTIDSNIFRVAGTTILFALVNWAVIIFCRVVYFVYLNSSLRSKAGLSDMIRRNKKPIYRILEFFYKTTMYPLLFFSLVTYHNWLARILVSHGFHHFTHILAIAVFVIYFTVTQYQFYMEVTSKVYRIENASEFVCDVLGGMIVAVSMHSKAYLATIAVFVLKGLVYIVSRKLLLRDFLNIEYLKVLSVALEVATVLVLLKDSAAAVVVLSILTILVQFVHQTAVVFLTDRTARTSKIKEPESVNAPPANNMVTESSESIVEIN